MTEEMKAKDATRYIVLKLPELSSIVGPFCTEGDARKAAEHCARKHPSTEFGIYQKVFSSRAELVVETKGMVG